MLKNALSVWFLYYDNQVPNLVAVETVDSEKIATKLESACISADREPKLIVYIQVINTKHALYTPCVSMRFDKTIHYDCCTV
jgi:hypothetical protein